MAKDRLEVKPHTVRNALLLTLGSLFFIGIGIVLVVSGEEPLGGIAAILIFGILGPIGVRNILRRRVAQVLTEQGMEQHYPQGKASISWSDVESISVVDGGVGIRLKNYDHYLDSMSPELAEYYSKMLSRMKLVAGAALVLRFVSDRGAPLWSRLPMSNEFEAIREFGTIGNVAEFLLYFRHTYGHDLFLNRQELDRSAEKFVELLESYRNSQGEA